METDRLYLREYVDTDLNLLHAIFSDAETMQYYPAPFSLEQTKNWMTRNRQRYQNDGVGLWAVCLKKTGQLIGDCGIVKQVVDRCIEMEIGYHIDEKQWSNGYATEAATACKGFGFRTLGFTKMVCIIDPGNRPSIRVAEKIGFRWEKSSHIFSKKHVIYAGFRQ